jgi:hypothetical protein
MNKIMKKSILILLIVLTTWNAEAQTPNSSVNGSIGKSNWSTRQASVKIILSSLAYSDSIILDKNTDSFFFKQVPYGIYELKIEANRGQTGLMDFVIEDVLINKEAVVLDTIFLFPVRTCDSKSLFWVHEYSLQKKEPKEYYSTGELFAEGNYFLAKKYSRKEKGNIQCIAIKKTAFGNIIIKMGAY